MKLNMRRKGVGVHCVLMERMGCTEGLAHVSVVISLLAVFPFSGLGFAMRSLRLGFSRGVLRGWRPFQLSPLWPSGSLRVGGRRLRRGRCEDVPRSNGMLPDVPQLVQLHRFQHVVHRAVTEPLQDH
jgi:hypothetical protein